MALAAPQHLDFAVRRAVFLPRHRLVPLDRPEQALEDAATVLARPEPESMLTALLTLRRVTTHHRVLIAGCL